MLIGTQIKCNKENNVTGVRILNDVVQVPVTDVGSEEKHLSYYMRWVFIQFLIY